MATTFVSIKFQGRLSTVIPSYLVAIWPTLTKMYFQQQEFCDTDLYILIDV